MKKSEKNIDNTEEVLENEPEVNESQTLIDEANKKALEAEDKYLRTLAEYENFRKRTAKEREGIYSDAYVDAVKSILPVIDNIERITAFADDEKLGEGINLIIASMKDTLTKMGVAEIETKTFDPNYHNAVMHVDDESLEEGAIVEVFQKGYMYKEKVIRYAMVKVAN